MCYPPNWKSVNYVGGVQARSREGVIKLEEALLSIICRYSDLREESHFKSMFMSPINITLLRFLFRISSFSSKEFKKVPTLSQG